MVSNSRGSDGSEDDSSRPWSPANRSEHNPFIAFRQMVDHQLSTMLRVLDEQTHQPGQKANEWRQQHADAPDDTQSRLFGIFSQPPLYERAMTRGTEQDSKEQETPSTQQGCSRWRDRWGQHHHRRHRHHEDDISKSNEQRSDGGDPDHPGSSFATHHHASFGPVMAALFSPHMGMTSYETWRVFSPYSPAHLATDPSLPATMQSRWHLAFLDLLALHNGEQMTQASESWRAGHNMDLHEAQSRLLRSKDRQASNWEDEEAGGFGDGGFGAMGHGPLGSHRGRLWSIGHGDEQDGGWMSNMLDNFFAGSQTSQDHKSVERRFKEEAALTEEDLYRWFLQQQGTDSSEKSKSTSHDPRQSANKTKKASETGNPNYPIPAYPASSMILSKSTSAHDSFDEQLAAEATARTVEQAQKLHRSHPDPFSWFQHDEHQSAMQRAWARAREEERSKQNRPVDKIRGGTGAEDATDADDTVIATLTQSHTTRNSDGSSRTISRVTRRFADGREETREDVDEGPTLLSSAAAFSGGAAKNLAAGVRDDASSKREKRAGSGWFWS